MLGWLFWGLVIGGTAVAIITIAVSYLNKAKAKNELKNKNIKRAAVRDIVKDPSVTHIKLDGLDEDGNEVAMTESVEEDNAEEIKTLIDEDDNYAFGSAESFESAGFTEGTAEELEEASFSAFEE